MKLKFIVLLLFLNFSQMTFAFSDNILGPFPVAGSSEEQQDIQQVLAYQKNRTAEQCATAQVEAKASLATIFGQKNGPLSQNEIKKLNSKLRWITVKSGVEIFANKTSFSRPRPYITYSEVKPCIDLESSKSYPSGHAALARMYARILSVIYPERALLFMKKADQAALNRVIGGVHYPSDILAGKILGDAMADEYLAENNRFYQLSVFNTNN